MVFWVVELLSGGEAPYCSMKSNIVIKQLCNNGEVFHPKIDPAWPESIRGLLQRIFVAEDIRIPIKEVASVCQDLKLATEKW